MHRSTWTRISLALAMACALTACGDDAPDPGTGGGTGGTGGGSGDTDAGTGGGTGDAGRYVVVSQGDESSFLVLVDALGAGATSGLDGLEVPGQALGVSFGDDPYVYVGSNDAPEITRYKVTAAGIVEDGSVSFAGYGTAETGGYPSNHLLFSKTKAYYIDSNNSQVIVWNPSEMTVIEALEHESIVDEGVRTGISGFPVFADGKYFVGLGWLNTSDLSVIQGAAALVIDTEADTAEVVRDPAERCGYTFSLAVGTDGIYLASESYAAAYYAISPDSEAPCMVRLDPGTLEFDAEYLVELPELVDGLPAGSIIPGPTDGQAYLRVLDEEALGMTLEEWRTGGEEGGPVGNARMLSVRQAWIWYDLTLGDEPTATLLDHPAGSGATLRVETGVERVIPEFDNPNQRTYIRDFDGNVYGDIILEAQGAVRTLAHVVPEG